MSTQLTDAAPVESGSSPVFVDSTGRRARLAKRVAWTVTACCVAYLALIGVSLAAGPVNPTMPIGGIFPALVPPAPQASAADPSSLPTSRTARNQTPARTRSSVAPPPPTAPVPAAPVVPSVTPAAPTTPAQPTPTSPPTSPSTSAPTSSAEPSDPSTTSPAPTSTEASDTPEEETEAAQPAAEETTPGGAA